MLNRRAIYILFHFIRCLQALLFYGLWPTPYPLPYAPRHHYRQATLPLTWNRMPVSLKMTRDE